MSILSKREYNKYFKKLGKELEFAASVALNDAAFEVSRALNEHTEEAFDKGSTKFTKKAFTVFKKAKKTDLEAIVGAKRIQGEYLSKAIYGGQRTAGQDYATGSEYIVVPGRSAKLNQYGNLPRNWLRAQGKVGASRNSSNIKENAVRGKSGRRTRKRKTDGGVFIGRAKVNNKTQLGIYKRPSFADRKSGRNQLKVLALLKKKTTYKAAPKFELFRTSDKEFGKTFRRSMNEAVRDIRKHGKVLSSFKRRQVK